MLLKGQLLSRESPIAIRMEQIERHDHFSAWAYRATMHPDVDRFFQNNQIQLSWLLRGMSHGDVSAFTISSAEQSRLDELFNASRKQLANIDKAQEEAAGARKTFWDESGLAEKKKSEDWDRLLKRVDEEWKGKLDVYNNQLALQAPAKYWTDKAAAHGWASFWFSLAFTIILVIVLATFIYNDHGIASLAKDPGQKPIALLLAPIAIFAFAAIWVLRILGRQLSRHLQQREDARERQTMVKTFLALMNEKNSGKIITDNDRILILHALFRPSGAHTPDDAPPHWFDLLTSKIGDKAP